MKDNRIPDDHIIGGTKIELELETFQDILYELDQLRAENKQLRNDIEFLNNQIQEYNETFASE